MICKARGKGLALTDCKPPPAHVPAGIFVEIARRWDVATDLISVVPAQAGTPLLLV